MKKKPILEPKHLSFLKIHEANATNITQTCKAAGIGRRTYYEWLKNDLFKEAIEALKESLLDFVESQLLQNIKGRALFDWKPKKDSKGRILKDENGEQILEKVITKYIQYPSDTAMIFFLKTQGRHRGYMEHQMITGDIVVKLPKDMEKGNESNKNKI